MIFNNSFNAALQISSFFTFPERHNKAGVSLPHASAWQLLDNCASSGSIRLLWLSDALH